MNDHKRIIAAFEVARRDIKRRARQGALEAVREARRETQDAIYDHEDARIKAIEASTDDCEIRRYRLLRFRKAARQVQRDMEDSSYDVEEKFLEYLEEPHIDNETRRARHCRTRNMTREYTRATKKSLGDFEEKFREIILERPNSKARGNHTKSPTLEPALATGASDPVATFSLSKSPPPQSSVTNGGTGSAVNSEPPITQQGPKSPIARKVGLCMPCFKLWRIPIEARAGKKIPECVLPEIGSRRKKCEGCVERRTTCTMIPSHLTTNLFKRIESLERSKTKGRDTVHDERFLEEQYFIVMENLEKETAKILKRKR